MLPASQPSPGPPRPSHRKLFLPERAGSGRTECEPSAFPGSRQASDKPSDNDPRLPPKADRSYSAGMAGTITIRTDEATEHALDVLTHDGSSRSAGIRQAVLEAAPRRERAGMRRAVLRMELGQPDGVNVAEKLARDRAGER